ncbi:flippase-like domain-containing protein [Pyrococcus sp. ST04]|uniref:lysylphosphatidylglycerol synthase transmembrane domain-containing protein n=1 Tax=Pyrococcus sp. ST04 TaxID=1183377 RepID=UPI00026059F2|nr:flippase-like domain-containing protein [Pyrococcus sp. ST04]AFK21923.1 putative Integral membrane protein [Pyrococcus sp. ST04]
MGRAKKYFTIFIGILIIMLLLWWAGLRSTLELMMKVNPRFLGLAVLMYCLTVFSWAIRWKVFLDGAGVHASFLRILEGVFVGIFLNNLTPGARTGGEAVKALYIARSSNGTYPKVFATVMADRILDVIPVAIFMIVAFIYAVGIGSKVLLYVLGVSILLIIVVLVLTVFFSVKENYAVALIMRLLRFLKKLFPRKIFSHEKSLEEKITSAIREFKSTLVMLAKKKREVLISMMWSFVLWISDVVRMYFVFLSLGRNMSIIQVLLVKMASMAIAMVSIIPGGIGINEAVQSALFLAIGVEKTLAVSATMLDRLISFWIPTVVGGVLVIKRRDVLSSSSLEYH